MTTGAAAAEPPSPAPEPAAAAASGMPVLQGPPNRACYKHTCAIQRCLQDSNYDSRACAWAVEALKACCRQPFAAGSVHCAFPDAQPPPRRSEKADDVALAEEKATAAAGGEGTAAVEEKAATAAAGEEPAQQPGAERPTSPAAE